MTDNKKDKIVLFTIILSILLLCSAKTGLAAENQSFRPYQFVQEFETDYQSTSYPTGDLLDKERLSSDGKFAIELRLVNRTSKIICFEINTNNIIWEYNINRLISPFYFVQSNDLNYTIFSSSTSFFVLDKHGKLVQKYDLNKRIRRLSLSKDGSNLNVETDNKLYVFSNNLNGEIIPYWIYSALGIVYESNWSKEGKFSISDSIQSLKQKTSIFSEFNPTIIYIGGIFVICVIVILFIPYYKRLKLKRDMARTPTDWCPNCLKFTGGAAICPHCGKATITEKYSDTKKREKKDK